MSWDGIRGTFQWMLFLLLVAMITVAGTVFHWWAEKDALIAETVHRKLEEILPDCRVEVRTIRLIDVSRLELLDMSVFSRVSGELLAKTPRFLIEIDPDILMENRQVVIREFLVESPDVYVVRDPTGRWSWTGIRPPPAPPGRTPGWKIDGATLHCGLQSLAGGEVREITLSRINVTLIPEAFRRYVVSGTGVADALGEISLTGFWDKNNSHWKLNGRAGNIRLDDPVLDLAGIVSPDVDRSLAQLRTESSPQEIFPEGDPAPDRFRTASLGNSQGELIPSRIEKQSPTSDPQLLRADVSLDFELGQSGAAAPLQYQITSRIQHGHVSDVVLPIPLYDLSGKITVTNDEIVIDDLQAANGASNLFVTGSARKTGLNWHRDFRIKATQLQLDERIRSFLNPAMLRLYDTIRPSGTFDIDLHYLQEPAAKPRFQVREFTAVNCRAQHELFQYPIENIHGNITQEGDTFHLALSGTASGEPIALNGELEHGIDKDAHLKIAVDDIPLDRRFVDALQRPNQQGARSALESLRLDGLVNVRATFVRDSRTNGQFKMQLNADVHGARCNFTSFPYEVTQLSGTVTHDALVADVWKFEDFQGRHGDAVLSGQGLFDLEESPGILGLRLEAVRVPVDHDLQVASTTANPHLEEVWSDFDLGGTIDVDAINIGWIPGETPRVTLEGIHWRDGRINPEPLPYAWDNLAGVLEWDGERLKIHTLNGWHGRTYVHIDGSDPAVPAFVHCPSGQPMAWRVYFGELQLVKLNPDDELRRALPEMLSQTLATLDLQHPIDLKLGIDLKGWTADPELVTAEWRDMIVRLPGNQLTAGVPLSNVTGSVNIQRGRWNGEQLFMEGYCELDSVDAFDLPFREIHGPFQVLANHLTLGTPAFGQAVRHDANNPFGGDQLEADLYEGNVALNAAASFADVIEDTTYRLEVSVQDVELAGWAADQQIRGSQLKGKVNGILELSGRGSSATASRGKGWVQITPAALYELPVFAQLLALRPISKKTAFNYAYGDFTVHDGLFDFSLVEMYGETLGIAGKGYVGYAGPRQSQIEFDFYSKADSRIPFVKPLIDQFGSNWIRIQALGTIAQPRLLTQPRIGPLDEAFRGFMQAVEAGQPRRPQPPRSIPRER